MIEIRNARGILLAQVPDTSILHFTGLHIPGAVFKGLNLEASFFDDCDITGADFTDSDLYGSVMFRTIADGANFTRACLREVDLASSKLRRANFREADLSPGNMGGITSLEQADVRGADFTMANLSKVNCAGALYDEHTLFPIGFDPQVNGMTRDVT